MIRVFGCSDDIVECEGAEYPNDEIAYAVWWIEVERRGTAEQTLTRCFDGDADIYSDIFEIDSNVEHVSVVPKERRK